jgi:MYXO-CTERM domain-containing protein
MRRLVASAFFAVLFIAGSALALDAGFPDAGLPDGGLPDAIATDAAGDAPAESGTDAAADAPAEAATDASDASAIKDAKSDVCDPNVEPCTTRADTGPDTDAGDVEEPGTTSGCSCNSAPAAASTAPIVFLLAAFAFLSRRRKR